MTEYKTKELTYWTAGVPMSSAARHFAPEELREQWQNASQKSALEEANASIQKFAGQERPSTMDLISAALEGMNSVWAPLSTIEKRAEALLLQTFKNKRAFALGFEAPRRIDADPHWISPEHLNAILNWSNSAIYSQSLHFKEVRILSLEQYQSITKQLRAKDDAESSTSSQPKQGRPAVYPAIAEAFAALLEAGQIDFTVNRPGFTGDHQLK